MWGCGRVSCELCRIPCRIVSFHGKLRQTPHIFPCPNPIPVGIVAEDTSFELMMPVRWEPGRWVREGEKARGRWEEGRWVPEIPARSITAVQEAAAKREDTLLLQERPLPAPPTPVKVEPSAATCGSQYGVAYVGAITQLGARMLVCDRRPPDPPDDAPPEHAVRPPSLCAIPNADGSVGKGFDGVGELPEGALPGLNGPKTTNVELKNEDPRSEEDVDFHVGGDLTPQAGRTAMRAQAAAKRGSGGVVVKMQAEAPFTLLVRVQTGDYGYEGDMFKAYPVVDAALFITEDLIDATRIADRLYPRREQWRERSEEMQRHLRAQWTLGSRFDRLFCQAPQSPRAAQHFNPPAAAALPSAAPALVPAPAPADPLPSVNSQQLDKLRGQLTGATEMHAHVL